MVGKEEKGSEESKETRAPEDAPEAQETTAAPPEGPFTHKAFPGVEFYHRVEAEAIEDGTTVLALHPEDLFLGVRSVKEQGFPILSCLSAYDRGDHFGVFYAFIRPCEAPEEFDEVRLRTVMPKKEGEAEEAKEVEPVCPSIVDLYPAAGWQEREMYDMYGIRFHGHPDLRRMFLPEGWHGYPMRKDYKEPEQFVAMQDGEDIVVQEQQEGSW